MGGDAPNSEALSAREGSAPGLERGRAETAEAGPLETAPGFILVAPGRGGGPQRPRVGAAGGKCEAPPSPRRRQPSHPSRLPRAAAVSTAATWGLAEGSRRASSQALSPGRPQLTAKPLWIIHIPGENDPLAERLTVAKSALPFTGQEHNVFLRPPAKMAVPSLRLAHATGLWCARATERGRRSPGSR